jgi:hypothetical protein
MWRDNENIIVAIGKSVFVTGCITMRWRGRGRIHGSSRGAKTMGTAVATEAHKGFIIISGLLIASAVVGTAGMISRVGASYYRRY